ncbi:MULTISPECIES: inositol monophosphatase family protein [Rhodococcus]|uniref:inositol-phosphate phosphatase n=1 Tax=Rhodococcus oxybenzonivorans TaxID=1990687 RepID=A0AAE5A412_9NOCA|nr:MULTISPECIES: inositol monophosphatase family protein [Rhodococcus]MDV7244097.1 inositol monophosphatase family protein [Rhodococcus oxybenzonivorans]MDV7263122.1 inositol monophosphatase family protein [Rhodococcus oxybenzonivorans]MDV7274661.1 inositol monophosphatase family protein [Rhodococcus oxybenzonivorans]MDV7335974.1 inositol monophosphatase family protein [Rhodococcus oxybenzonivorans]MDV7345611.1 inositol monophosphatase family protein [Rhodococcus oxybenzonivorans]
MSPDRDPQELLAVAGELLDGVHDRFVAGVGSPSAVHKGPDDFATALDLELEKRLTGELQDRTGIAVHGEEFGGPDLDAGLVWVLDPIDGTFNYSAGLPTAGTLLALLDDGVPVLGLTWLPLVGRRYAAVADGPLLEGGLPLPRLTETSLASSIVGMGALNIDSRGRIPGPYRLQVLAQLSRVSSRIRIHGSTGVDLAFTAAGILGGTVVFGHNAWDNAAGVALVRAAGGVVTDLAGQPWTIASDSVLAGAPGVHGEILDILGSLGDPRADLSEGRT